MGKHENRRNHSKRHINTNIKPRKNDCNDVCADTKKQKKKSR